MWLIVLSWCISATLVMTLVFCLCWRKKASNDEWQGLDGMVTQKNPDENVNHLPSAASCIVDGTNASGESAETKRNTITNTRRSLPDIPAEQEITVNWDPTGDNSSELYATVGQYQNQVKRHTIANGVDARPSISQHSSISQADDTFSPYERVKYDKIQSKEHPYAQLQPTSSRSAVSEEIISTSDERINLLRVEVNPPEPTVPNRSRRSSTHSGDTTGGLDIPAASAVAGVLAASPELPYMTPPVVQSNFSGDSQDSSKGYTSISVREPLANIIAQTKEINLTKRELDPHYSTVSDDSDDVYTTIPDPNNPIYTSESETYARIPPHPITVEAEVNAPPSPLSQNTVADENDEDVTDVGDQLYEPPPQPQPPSVDSLKQVASQTTTNQPIIPSHSRQASSSSSIANMGSPKPEKRQANSPLPPPPTICNFDFHSEKLQSMRNLDDLYAKVHKNKKEDFNSGERKSPDNTQALRPLSGTNQFDSKMHEKQKREHNYETLKKSSRRTSDPGYEKIRGSDEPGYASINGPESITNSDPGYEVLKDRAPSESDPNYEELRHRVSNASDCSGYTKIKEKDLNDGYSVVNKRKKKLVSLPAFNADDDDDHGDHNDDDGIADEPNYESMPSETNSDPNYYSALRSNGSESDPNYESVEKNDPNYESVKYLDDPPYERLDEDVMSKTSSDISGYEKVRKKGNDTSESSNSAAKSLSDRTEPPYEQLNDTDSEIPGYERIKNKNSILSPNSSGSSVEPINSSNILDEDGIFQV